MVVKHDEVELGQELLEDLRGPPASELGAVDRSEDVRRLVLFKGPFKQEKMGYII